MPKPEIQIFVCLNERPEGAPKPSCGHRGSTALYYRLKDLVRERRLRDLVLVNRVPSAAPRHGDRISGLTLLVSSLRASSLPAACIPSLRGAAKPPEICYLDLEPRRRSRAWKQFLVRAAIRFGPLN